MTRSIGIDTWEGQLEIDEAVLKANGVAFMFVRLNDMNGGHHKDTGFDRQWLEAKNFYRAPYFVYNPWVSGLQNFQWLQANMPAGTKTVAVDIEVRMTNYPSTTYATEVAKFEALLKANHFRYVIYTGEWFLQYLSTWNKDADYWWAQYPLEFYPATVLHLTWDELRARLAKYTGPFNAAKVPGRLKFWQFSGDRLILPGNNREMDVNVFMGTEAELAEFFGGVVAGPVEGVTTPYEGMTLTQGLVNGWDFCLFKIDPRKFRFEVVALNPPETIGSVVKRKGAIAGWNTGDYDRFTYAIQDYLVASGREVVARDRLAARPSLMFNGEGLPIFDIKNAANVQEAFTGIRPLVEVGTVSTKLFDMTQAQNTEGHARFAFGLDASGNVLLFSSRGIHPSVTVFDGLRLKEVAQVLQSQGAQAAADGGGGGDVTVYLNGRSLIVPENVENGVNFERPLPAALLLYAKENISMGTTLKGTSTIDGLNLKDGAVVVFRLAKGQVVYGNFSATKTDLIDIRRVYAADGKTLVTSFATPVKTSAAYLTVVAGQDPAEIVAPPPPPPPPTTEPDSIEVKVVENGVVKTYKIVGEITVT